MRLTFSVVLIALLTTNLVPAQQPAADSAVVVGAVAVAVVFEVLFALAASHI